MHINRIEDSTKAHTNRNNQSLLAAKTKKADTAACCANCKITCIEAMFPTKLDITPPPARFQNPTIQVKRATIYAHVPSYKKIAIGTVKVEGIMPKIRQYAYQLCEYALAMKIALDQPDLVANSNIMYIAQFIVHHATFILDREDLTNYIHIRLQQVAPTIHKNYSRHIADFVLNDADVISAYHVSSDYIIDILQSIVASAHATINKIDNEYHEINEVFFKADEFKRLRNNAYDAFERANKADSKVQNVSEPLFRHSSSLQELQQAFDYTTQAKSAAKNAKDAYRRFAEYFDKFIPTIQTMLNNCNALIHNNYDGQAVYIKIYLYGMIRIIKSDIERALHILNDAVWESHKAANQYNNSYKEYDQLIKDRKMDLCKSYEYMPQNTSNESFNVLALLERITNCSG